MKKDLGRAIACEACLRDEKLVEWVRERGKAGVCPWCASRDVYVIDLDELGPLFREVAKIYAPSEGLHGDAIGFLLQEDFEPFSELIKADPDLRDELAAAILKAGLTKDDVDEPDYDGYFHRATSSLEEDWDSQIDGLFRREPDNHGSNLSRVDPLGLPDRFTVAIEDLCTALPVGSELFRSRLHEERRRTEWYGLEEMGAPPAHKAKAQRANHLGQPVLYLASDMQTALAEVRGWRGAVVAVATMVAKWNLRLVDLVTPRSIDSPFFDEWLGWTLELRGLLFRVGEELSRPILPNEEETLYRTSRHFCDRIREIGMDGVIYPSALGPGRNVVLFDVDSAVATSVDYVRIANVLFESDSLMPGEQPYGDLPWGFPD